MIKKYIKLYRFIGPYIRQQIFMASLCLIGMLVSILTPYLMALFINQIQDGKTLSVITRTGIFIGIVSFVASLLNTAQNYVWHRFRVKFINHIRLEMFKATINKKLVYFKENKSGDILSKILYDVTSVAEHIAIGIPMLLINIIRLLAVFVLMALLNIRLTLIVLVTAPIYCLLFNLINKHLRENSLKEREEFSKVTGNLQEDISGIYTIKIFKKENYFTHKFQNVLNQYINFVNKNLFFQAVSYGTTDMIQSMLPIAILLVGSMLISKGSLKIGSLIGFYAYLNYIYEPMANLSDWFIGVQTTLGMSDRVTEFLEDPEYIKETEEEKKKMAIDEITSIEFKNVSFSYDKKDKVLNNLNFKIEKGDKVAIVGPSGKGKSTLIQLMLKVYEGYTGEILINGISIRDIAKTSIYENVSLVEQNLFIFDGTVKENILFDQQDSIHLLESMTISQTDVFVKGFEKALNHLLLEGGKNISGGQKQRICISRALAKCFDVLILDEATSSLDKELEKEVVENIDKYVIENNKILISISHRHVPVSICNKIINLD
ncbi:ABC transporter ATP-binding protein/permease [Clostridium sp. MSJ-4]|uniref:ABC transporter ATP-binding protein/permease n=1 Tax=Clostridium simiarum TaxID=2841506 RepID=A0ABS6EYG7_9CLOT|nr:ABC transporter ATP-binding protein [Clostridium simiarum]MBU5591272.1 ABC transporter ATP-binding protein/permease [Clostridium simiarum]